MQADSVVSCDSSAGEDCIIVQLPGFDEWFHEAIVLTKIYRTEDADCMQFLHQVGKDEISEANKEKLKSRVGVPCMPAGHKVLRMDQ